VAVVRSITPATPAWRPALAELWEQREVVRAFALRSLRIRYRQAYFGALWTVAQPLALLLPYVWLFPGPQGGTTVAATLAGLIGWQYLSLAVSGGAGALVNEAFLVRKTFFAREAPVVAAVAAALVDLALGLALYGVLAPFLGAHAGWATLVGTLAGLGGLVVVASAVAIPLAALNAQFRDVRHALPFAVLVWLFVSPVFIPLPRHHGWLLAVVNPAAGPLDALRRGLAEGRLPGPALPLSLVSALVVGAVGHRWFRRVAPTLADVV
jgi:ABC-type polysaccharide/polyol phosphate export permease